MQKDIKDMLVKFGWSKYENDLWIHKNIIGEMTFEQAVIIELERLLEFDKAYFVCPDCEYKITPNEFLTGGKKYDEELELEEV